jgi:hypothetical protein
LSWVDGEAAWIAAHYLHGHTQRQIADELGLTPACINVQVRRFCEVWARQSVELVYDSARKVVLRRALDRYLIGGGVPIKPDTATKRALLRPIPYFDETYSKARYEHAWLLRAEGESLQVIGDRVGVSRERAGQMILKYGRTMTWAMLRTRFRIAA